MEAKKYKRMNNILYRLREKNIRCSIRERTIFYPFGKNPYEVLQIRRLLTEFNFVVQTEIE